MHAFADTVYPPLTVILTTLNLAQITEHTISLPSFSGEKEKKKQKRNRKEEQ